MKNREYEQEIDLLEIFKFLIKRWYFLIAGAIVGILIAGVITYFQTPMYESQSMLYILSKTTSLTSYADIQIGSSLTNDFLIIAKSKPVIDTAIQEVNDDMGTHLTRAEAMRLVTVSNEANTRLLKIKVLSEDPELSCNLANAVASATSMQMENIMQSDPPTTVERAEVPSVPNSNNMRRNLVVGALLGLLVVAIIYIVIFLSNDKIKTPDDVEKYLEETVLGAIPLDKSQVTSDKKRKKTAKSAKGKK